MNSTPFSYDDPTPPISLYDDSFLYYATIPSSLYPPPPTEQEWKQYVQSLSPSELKVNDTRQTSCLYCLYITRQSPTSSVYNILLLDKYKYIYIYEAFEYISPSHSFSASTDYYSFISTNEINPTKLISIERLKEKIHAIFDTLCNNMDCLLTYNAPTFLLDELGLTQYPIPICDLYKFPFCHHYDNPMSFLKSFVESNQILSFPTESISLETIITQFMNENDYILDFQDTRTVIEDHEYCLSTCSFEKKQRDTIQSFYAIADTVEEAHSKLYAYLYLYLFNVTVPTIFVQFNSFFEPSIFFNCFYNHNSVLLYVSGYTIFFLYDYLSPYIQHIYHHLAEIDSTITLQPLTKGQSTNQMSRMHQSFAPLSVDQIYNQKILHKNVSSHSIDSDTNSAQIPSLYLIVDLDLTLIHAGNNSLFGDCIYKLETILEKKDFSILSKDISEFALSRVQSSKKKDEPQQTHMWMKLRPGVRELLNKLKNKYELVVYTQGEADYARNVIYALDPENTIFKNRIISRESPNLRFPYLKCYSDLCYFINHEWKEYDGHHVDTSSLLTIADLIHQSLILDDRPEVWRNPFLPQDGKETNSYEQQYDPQRNVYPCAPYVFFSKTERTAEQVVQQESIEKQYMKVIENQLLTYYHEYRQQYQQYLAEKEKFTASPGTPPPQEPDIRSIMEHHEQLVLQGESICFTGLIPSNMEHELHPYWITAKTFGAECTEAIIPNKTTHLIASNKITAKVKQAQALNIPIVRKEWLLISTQRFQKEADTQYLLYPEYNPAALVKKESTKKQKHKRSEYAFDCDAQTLYKDLLSNNNASPTTRSNNRNPAKKRNNNNRPGNGYPENKRVMSGQQGQGMNGKRLKSSPPTSLPPYYPPSSPPPRYSPPSPPRYPPPRPNEPYRSNYNSFPYPRQPSYPMRDEPRRSLPPPPPYVQSPPPSSPYPLRDRPPSYPTRSPPHVPRPYRQDYDQPPSYYYPPSSVPRSSYPRPPLPPPYDRYPGALPPPAESRYMGQPMPPNYRPRNPGPYYANPKDYDRMPYYQR